MFLLLFFCLTPTFILNTSQGSVIRGISYPVFRKRISHWYPAPSVRHLQKANVNCAVLAVTSELTLSRRCSRSLRLTLRDVTCRLDDVIPSVTAPQTSAFFRRNQKDILKYIKLRVFANTIGRFREKNNKVHEH